MQNRQQSLGQAAVTQIAELLLDRVDPALIGTGSERVQEFLARVGSSSPRARDEDGKAISRWQDRVIEQEIPVGSSVLDLGCGNGDLLARLRDMKQVRGQGIEINSQAVMHCVKRGVPVCQIPILEGIRAFPDRNFDYVVLEETLQTLQQPAVVLNEMLRVGRRGIVSFPNFGYWRVRLDLGVRGRMPVTEWLPHRWYDTPNIHLLTLQDFVDWAEEEDVHLVESYVLCEGQVRQIRPEDNFYAEEVLLVIERK